MTFVFAYYVWSRADYFKFASIHGKDFTEAYERFVKLYPETRVYRVWESSFEA